MTFKVLQLLILFYSHDQKEIVEFEDIDCVASFIYMNYLEKKEKRMNKLILILLINALIQTKIIFKAQRIFAQQSKCQANCNGHGTCTRSSEIKGLNVII